MFNPKITKRQITKLIDCMSDIDFARFLYCQHIAATHLAVGQFEDMLISAMFMCDRVKIKTALGQDMEKWEQTLAKRALLQDSTVGSLIKILEGHCIATSDIAYLKWVKDKRDYFIHRLFHGGAWPGDLDFDECHVMIRRLMAIQLWLGRAQRNIWLIFERAGFVELDRLADGGYLATNMGLFDLFEPADV